MSETHGQLWPSSIPRPGRLLVVLPSWLGDAVMATPALRLLRDAMPGAYIAGLARPGVAELLEGISTLDEVFIERAQGVMGPKRAAGKLRPLRFDAALLLTNSFSTALVTRLAGIPVRVGYNRDGRGPFLTHKLKAPEWPGSSLRSRRWAPVSAVAYYYAAARALLGDPAPSFESLADPMAVLPAGAKLELPLRDEDRAAAARVLRSAGIETNSGWEHGQSSSMSIGGREGRGGCGGCGGRLCVFNPGANNPAKRWPAERFGALGESLATSHGVRILISTGPGEDDVAQAVARACKTVQPIVLAAHGHSLSSLKGILARASLLVTNDTGPRHLAAAFGTPTVALFGPTDPRWTTLPEVGSSTGGSADGVREQRVCAGELGAFELADEHPDRCAIEKISLEEVRQAAQGLLDVHLGKDA